MADEGTSFTIDLPVTGKERIDAASLSIDALAAKLDTVSKASKAASDSVKAGEAAYRKAEAAADRQAQALEKVAVAAELQKNKLKQALDANDEKAAERASIKLRELNDVQEKAAAKADKLKAKLAESAKSLDTLRAAATKAEDAEKKLDKALEAKKEQGSVFDRIAGGLSKLGGPFKNVGDKLTGIGEQTAGAGEGLGKLTSALGAGGTAALAAGVAVAALVVGVIALSVAVVKATADIATWAVGLANVNRESRFLAQSIVQSTKGGDQLNSDLKSIARTLPVTQEQLADLARGFAYAGYRGQDLKNAVEQAATWTARLKFGPNFREEMLSLSEQSKIFRANIADLFGGLKIDGVLRGLQRLIALFDSSTASGRAIKVVFESIFQPLVDQADGASIKIERFFLQLEILALKALIALKPHASLFLLIGKAALIGAAVIGGVLAYAVFTLVAGLVALVAVIGAAAVGLFKFAEAAFNIGKAIVTGLVHGIIDGTTAVVRAVTGVVTGAITAAKKLLGIASPSKVFAEIGMQTGAGMEAGVTRATPGVQTSLESMVAPPSSGTSAAPAAAPAAPAARSSVTGNTFVFHGVKDAEDAEGRMMSALLRLVEGDGAQLGAAVPG